MAGTFCNLLYHIIFSTKGRLNLIDPRYSDELYAYVGGIIRGESGHMLCVGGTADHLHVLFTMPATLSVSDLVRKIKGNSSKWVNGSKRPKIKFSWQRGYGAFTVSESAKQDVISYIQKQEEHHRHRSFQEEFIGFLKRHNIPYDERYIWD